jgi:hypothetical protein
MSNTTGGQALGATAAGSSALAVLGVPVETSVMIGLYILFLLLGFYLIYKIRNRNLR